MKELAKKIAAFIVCTVVIVQVMSISSFASGEDREPNDKITQANSVSLNTTIYGTTSGGWDMDYYKFTLNSPGYISVLFYHDDGNNGHHIDLYDYDGTTDRVIWNYNVYETSLKKETLRCGLAAGTYYISVSGNNKLGVSQNTYNFRINYTKASNWESEENGKNYRADSISVDTTFYGSTMGNNQDFDYYKFTLSKSGYISILFNHNLLASNGVILSNSEGKRLLNFDVYQNVSTKTSQRIYLTSDTYYLLIAGYDNEYSFKVQYASENTQQTTQKPTQKTTKKTTDNRTTTKNNYTRFSTTAKPNGSTSKSVLSTARNEEITSVTYKPFEEDVTVNEREMSVSGDFRYYIENNIVIINNYFGNQSYVEIPEEIGGLAVGCIAGNAFENTGVSKIKIPSSVTQFGENAFGESDHDVKIICEQGSAAQDYAQRNGLDIELTVSNNINIDNSEKSDNSENSNSKVLIIVFGSACLAVLLGILAFMIIKHNKEKHI